MTSQLSQEGELPQVLRCQQHLRRQPCTTTTEQSPGCYSLARFPLLPGVCVHPFCSIQCRGCSVIQVLCPFPAGAHTFSGVRLATQVNGSVPHSGRLEVQLGGGVWSTVYASQFEPEAAINAAGVACRTLGLRGGTALYEKRGQGPKGHYLKAYCKGGEASLAQCMWEKLLPPTSAESVYLLDVECAGGHALHRRQGEGAGWGGGGMGQQDAGLCAFQCRVEPLVRSHSTRQRLVSSLACPCTACQWHHSKHATCMGH